MTSSKLSGNQKLGALFTAILPIVASIYGQQAERRDQVQARSTAARAQAQSARKEADEADSKAAERLSLALQETNGAAAGAGRDKSAACATLYTGLKLLRVDAPTPKTESVLVAWLSYRDEKTGALIACDCRRNLAEIFDDWGRDSLRKRVSRPMIETLDAAMAECTTGVRLLSPPVTPRTDCTTALDAVLGPPTPPPVDQDGQAVPTSEAAGARIRVFVHVATEKQKAEIAPLNKALSGGGYQTDRVEVVGERRAPRCAELRFVYESDATAATKLFAQLKADPSLLLGQPVRLTRLRAFEGRALPRVFEVWVGKDCPMAKERTS